MGDSDRIAKMEIDYSSIVDQKLKECDELLKVDEIVYNYFHIIAKLNLGSN